MSELQNATARVTDAIDKYMTRVGNKNAQYERDIADLRKALEEAKKAGQEDIAAIVKRLNDLAAKVEAA